MYMYQNESCITLIIIVWGQLFMIEERRWPMGSKRSIIHAGEGVIADIKWRGNYIVWANDTVSVV